MAFAFFWLVMGDLITLHQKAIYGFNPFGLEMPYAKTDHSPNKTKIHKSHKPDKVKDQFHTEFIPELDYTSNRVHAGYAFTYDRSLTVFILQYAPLPDPPRGPPSL